MKGRSLTVSYSALQASFWMDLCIALSFASVYLKDASYSNSALGLIIAAGSLFSALLGPALSSLIDRYERISAARFIGPLAVARAAAIAGLLLCPGRNAVTTVCYICFIGISLSVNSLLLKMYADASYDGAAIDYGIARGSGSLAYVLLSFALGALVKATSARAIPLAAAAVCAFQYISFLAFRRALSKALPAAEASNSHDAPQVTAAEASAAHDAPQASGSHDSPAARGSGLIRFAADNPRYCVLLLGTLLIFFSHNTLCNFLINVTENIGGDAASMGFLNGFMATVEIPVIMLFSKIFGKKDMSGVLLFSFAFFTLKAVAVAAASSVPAMAAAFVLQAPSFALYTPAIVPYVEAHIRHEDSAKAQSLAFTMTTFASVLAGAVSGRMLDHMTVTATLWIAAAVCLAGSVIAAAGLEKKKAG